MENVWAEEDFVINCASSLFMDIAGPMTNASAEKKWIFVFGVGPMLFSLRLHKLKWRNQDEDETN